MSSLDPDPYTLHAYTYNYILCPSRAAIIDTNAFVPVIPPYVGHYGKIIFWATQISGLRTVEHPKGTKFMFSRH